MELKRFACPYGEVRGKPPVDGTPDLRGVVCSRIVALVGMRCGHALPGCGPCNYIATGDDSVIRIRAKAHIANLLISGNGRTNYADTVDILAMAERFKAMSTLKEREEIIAKAEVCQSIPPEKGGYEPEIVEDHLKELETALGLIGIK